MASYINTLGVNVPEAADAPDTYVDPEQAFSGDQGASETIGRLSRARWKDWKTRYKPYVESLANAATRDGADEDAARMAQDSVNTAYENSAQARQMQRQGLGMQASAAQREADQRRQNVQKMASMASAGNTARTSALDRQSKILAGGMGLSNIPDQVLEQQQ